MATVAPEIRFIVTERMVEQFAALTGDRSSLHTDSEYARRSIYGRRVAHGMLPLAFLAVSPMLSEGGKSGWIKRFDGHFSGPVFIGDEVEVVLRPPQSDAAQATLSFDYRVENLTQATVVASGNMVVAVSSVKPLRIQDIGRTVSEACLLEESLSEACRGIDDVSKGDSAGFHFRISDEAVAVFHGLLRSGLESFKSGPVDIAVEVPNILATSVLSTLVGMVMPGRTATFVDFSLEFHERIATGERQWLECKVAHVSRGAKMLRSSISLGLAGGQPVVANGHVVTLVNPVVNERIPSEDLTSSAVDLGLRDKVVLITGASGGIGDAIARLFAFSGSRVVINYRRNAEHATRIVNQIEENGGSAIALRADLTDSNDISRMIATVISKWGSVDILVNNAYRDFKPIAWDNLEWEEIQRDLDVAVKGAFLCCKAVSPLMIKAGGGKIINVSSVYAEDPPPDQIKYVIAKSALNGLTRALAAEFADKNIQVNAVVPSFVETGLASHMYAELRKKRAKDSPMQRNARPDDVAKAVLFLASAYSSYTTGQKLFVTGGSAPFL